MDKEYPCPQCNSKTDWRLECPGYGGEGKVMVCYPPCGNAIEYFCTNEACQWWHRSPNNRSDKATMGAAPSWLAEALDEFKESNEEDDDKA